MMHEIWSKTNICFTRYYHKHSPCVYISAAILQAYSQLNIMGPTEAIKACFFVKGVWKRQWISPSSEGVHLTRSKDVTGSHLKVNGYAVSGHHAQFPQPHLSSHVGKGSDADVQLPKRANRNDSLSKFPIFTRYISGTGIHWCDAVLLPGARFGIWSKGWSCSNS